MEKIPDPGELSDLMGENRYELWAGICREIEGLYEMERLWSKGGKAWDYEYKYQRGKKTLCALYARKNCFGFMVIFGKQEREKFEAERHMYPAWVQSVYDEAATYHDGKWMMFQPEDPSCFGDLMKLLRIKRKPNR